MGICLLKIVFEIRRFHLQQIQPVSLNRLETKLGALTGDEFRALGKQLAALLKLYS
jgi:hypothetical protein